jgi:hypothetical protein
VSGFIALSFSRLEKSVKSKMVLQFLNLILLFLKGRIKMLGYRVCAKLSALAPKPIDMGLVIRKRRILNEMAIDGQSLMGLRLISIYLALVDMGDPSTREVRFLISDFEKLLPIKSKVKKSDINAVGAMMTSPSCHLDVPGYEVFRLFRKFGTEDFSFGATVLMDVSEEAFPLVFGCEAPFFTYRLSDLMGLRSVNQFRLYEILKGNLSAMPFIMQMDALRRLLGMAPGKLPSFAAFRRDVLDACKKAMVGRTDISFDYAPYGTNSKRKVTSVVFLIEQKGERIDALPPRYPHKSELAGMQGGRRFMDDALKRFMLEFGEVRGISMKFYEERARQLFIGFMARSLGGRGSLRFDGQIGDKAHIVIQLSNMQHVVEMRVWRGSSYDSRSDEDVFSFLESYKQSEGWLVSFNPSGAQGAWEITSDGKRIYEAVV